MKLYQPKTIYVESAAKNKRHTSEILDRLKNIPVVEIENRHELIRDLKSKPDPYGEAKRSLLLAYDEGETFKPFRESEQYLSCDYFTLHAQEGCDLECSYCFLQTHLTLPLLTIYVHLDQMLEGLQKTLNANPDQLFRIGTGQLSDSLSLDHITAYSEALVPFFAKQKNATLEMKTKSNNIDRLLKLEPKEKTIVSWSMNSKKIQSEEEHKCATIEERIAAAKKVSEHGYRVGFHFDPVIDYPGWQKDYEEVITQTLQTIPAEKIAWISMGCFRGEPELKKVIGQRFPKSQIPLGHWVRGMDGKIRLFKPKRIEIYQTLAKMIQKFAPDTTLYLSMESSEVWREVFGGEHTKETICKMLDQTAVQQGVNS